MASSEAKAGAEADNIFKPKQLQELVERSHPGQKLDPAVEMLLLEIAEEFVDDVAEKACRLAKHRNSKTVGIKDVQLHLEKAWNMKLPGSFSGTSVKRRHHLITSAGKSRLTMRKKTTARKKVQKTSSGGGGRKVSPKRSGKSSSNR